MKEQDSKRSITVRFQAEGDANSSSNQKKDSNHYEDHSEPSKPVSNVVLQSSGGSGLHRNLSSTMIAPPSNRRASVAASLLLKQLQANNNFFQISKFPCKQLLIFQSEMHLEIQFQMVFNAFYVLHLAYRAK